jgi:DNA helicase-2/ATP-dependent DNA helicase PcrA
MPESGRSQPAIIDLANHLIDWTMNAHPDLNVRDALSIPYIVPVPEDDPQQNPPDNPKAVQLIPSKFAPEQELDAVVKSVKKYVDSIADLPEEQKPTIAVLVPRNFRGIDVIEALKKLNIEIVELISSTSETRAAAGSLNYLLSYLADPQSANKLSKAYQVWRRDWRDASSPKGGDVRALAEAKQFPENDEVASSQKTLLATTSTLLKKILHVEDYIAPSHEDLLYTLSESEEVIEELRAFRVNVQRWLNAVTLPIDQLILTLAQDVFTQPADLALAHKLALVLRQTADDHHDWRLPELTSELTLIAKNERRFIGFSEDDSGFDPERHRGKVVVVTMHKAKGLEWDRVYMMSVNNYDFPSNEPHDHFISEKWFVRGGLNLEAEALAQLNTLESNSEYDWYEEGAATMQSRLGYVKERLRLLYVGITRAKKELIVTWNTGRKGDATPSLALQELIGWWEGK